MNNLKTILNIVKDDRLILTPGVFQWLTKHPEGLVLTTNEADLLTKLTMIRPRNRAQSFSCSARVQCVRRQQFTYIGVPTQSTLDAPLQNKFNDGTWRHLRWQMMLLKATLLEKVEVPVWHEGYNLLGSMDGEGVNDKFGKFGFELKGIGSLSFLKEGPHLHHLYQIHSYFVARPDLDVFSLIYEDKMTQVWKEFVIERDPKIMRSVRKELVKLNTATNHRKLLPILEGCKNGRGPDFRACPYSGICLTATWKKAERSAA